MHLRGPGPQPLGSLPGGRNAHVLGVMETTAGTPKSPSHTRTPDRNRRNCGEVGGGCVPTCCCCRAKCHQSRGFEQPSGCSPGFQESGRRGASSSAQPHEAEIKVLCQVPLIKPKTELPANQT